MTIKEVKDLIKILDDSDLAEFQYKNKDVELRIRSNKFFEHKGQTIVSAPVQMASPAAIPPPAPSGR